MNLITFSRTILSSLVRSYNQPKFCPLTTWNTNATTVVQSSATFPFNPAGVFVNTNNTLFVSTRANPQILIWSEGNNTLLRYFNLSDYNQFHLFVTDNGDGYVSNGYYQAHYYPNGTVSHYYPSWVNKWTINSTRTDLISYLDGYCFGIFVSVSNSLYCSIEAYHKVVRRWLDDTSPTWTIVAGIHGNLGSTSTTLYNPRGIFVDINFDLYVADGANDRIQLFRLGQSDGITVAGGAVSNTTITLNNPMAVILDADKYLFILDSGNQSCRRFRTDWFSLYSWVFWVGFRS